MLRRGKEGGTNSGTLTFKGTTSPSVAVDSNIIYRIANSIEL